MIISFPTPCRHLPLDPAGTMSFSACVFFQQQRDASENRKVEKKKMYFMSELVCENQVVKYSNKLHTCFSYVIFLTMVSCHLIAFLCVKSTVVLFA